MALDVVFWVFLIGIIIASLQDLKRREVDHWLTLALMVFGFAYIAFEAIFSLNSSVVVLGIVSFLTMFVIMNLFYYGRIFGGGDAKLLFAMFVIFIGASAVQTMINIGWFILFLMLAGSVYGLIYSVVLFGMNFKKVKVEFKKGFENIWARYAIVAGIILFVLSYIDWLFFIPAIFLLIGPVLFIFAKSLESVVMIKKIKTSELREGDWLVEDFKVGRKVIEAEWGGLSLEDIKFIKKSKKKIEIKEGLPFVPAFLMAFLAYYFLRSWFFGLLIG
jgi:Flp pilus assembly protein protease CpaA